MTIKKVLTHCLCLLFSSGIAVEAFADLSPTSYAFSNLFQKSELIVAGYVSEVSANLKEYQITFIAERSIMDPLNRISIITALERNPNKVEALKSLKELQTVQAKPLVSSILKKRISKLE